MRETGLFSEADVDMLRALANQQERYHVGPDGLLIDDSPPIRLRALAERIARTLPPLPPTSEPR